MASLNPHWRAPSRCPRYPHARIFADRPAGWREIRAASRTTMVGDGVFYAPEGEEFLILSERGDVREALASQDLVAITGVGPAKFTAHFRRVLRRAITPAAKTWVERFGVTASALIDTLARSGGCEAMRAAAWPLAGHVFAAMCGVGVREVFPTGRLDITCQMERARAKPGNDLFSRFLAVAPGLSDHEYKLLVDGAWHGVRVGIAQTFSYALLELAHNPALRAWLREHPDDIDGLVDEIVRLEPVAPAVMRWAMRRTQINGMPIPADSWVLVAMAAADREGDSDQVNVPPAKPRNHFGFCGGRWLCPGIHVARGALRVALESWLTAIPDFDLEPGFGPRVWGAESFGPFTLRELPLRW